MFSCWNMYLHQGLVERKMGRKLLCLYSWTKDGSKNSSTVGQQWRARAWVNKLWRMKKGGLSGRPQPESYVFKITLLQSSCVIPLTPPHPYFENYFFMNAQRNSKWKKHRKIEELRTGRKILQWIEMKTRIELKTLMYKSINKLAKKVIKLMKRLQGILT